MSFFSRKRAELLEAGIDPDRVPPGQYVTDRFPVLHAGVVPVVDLAAWRFNVEGLVAEPRTWDWEAMAAMPTSTLTADIHCVTKWTKLDTVWEGVAVTDVWAAIEPDPSATHVLVNAYHGFTANLPIADLVKPGNLLAHTYAGAPLEPEHGWPMRLVVPRLYFWKSVKWVTGFTLMEGDRPGFWERNGYHMYGDPWKEERFW